MVAENLHADVEPTREDRIPEKVGTELDRMVAEDVMRREARAKAALESVLRQSGCSDEQIQDVMDRVDNEPENPHSEVG